MAGTAQLGKYIKLLNNLKIKGNIYSYYTYNILGLLFSLLSTLILLKAIGKTNYGNYVYYISFAELIVSIIVFGFDQSINQVKYFKNLDLNLVIKCILKIRLFIYILVLFPILIYPKEFEIKIFFLLLFSILIFDLNYINTLNNSIKIQARSFFLSKLVLYLTTSLISQYSDDFIYFLYGYLLSFIVQSTMNSYRNYQNISFTSLQKINIIKLLYESFPFSLVRVFVFLENFLVIFIGKNNLNFSEFNLFVVSISIAKLILSFLSMFITPSYNLVTLNQLNPLDSIKKLSKIGILIYILIFFAYIIFENLIYFNLMIIDNFFVSAIKIGIIISIFSYISSIIFNIFFLSQSKKNGYYLFRILYIFTFALLNYYININIFLALIISEVLVLLIIFLIYRNL